MDCLYIIVPCFNEENALPLTSEILKNKLISLINAGKISKTSKIVFVNDGSTDNTWEIIETLHKNSDIFSGINLSRNRGHQNALLCGLLTMKDHCDLIISIDADLQDDVNAIDIMMDKYISGCDIVYGVRNNRDSDSFFKKFSAKCFLQVYLCLYMY